MSRIVVVTGGNRGIGAAISEAFLELGDTVAVFSRSGEGPAGTKGFVCDVSNTASVEAAFDKLEADLGPAEIVVANAGLTKDTLLMRMSDEDLEAVINTNLIGAIRVARRASKTMLRARKGRLIFISSVVAMLGSAGQVNYSASKSGLIGAARSMARELGPRGITANVIAPGFVDTDMTAVLSEDQKSGIVANVPLGRYANVNEIAGVATFLASPAASYVTGAVLPVDGGLGMGH
jgi:3-oxoacyl-[acyl-carrier protein] reductase